MGKGAALYKPGMVVLTWACLVLPGYALVLNDPYPASQSLQDIYYSSFTEQPKTLDPAQAYSSNEYQFINQIYEPLLQYDYYERPYQLAPLLATEMPAIVYLDKNNQPIVQGSGKKPAYSVYTLKIKKGIYYQPHPSLAKDEMGQYRYLHLPDDYLAKHHIETLAGFEYSGTREVVADDFIYQIKRLANPQNSAPVYGLLGEHIVGFTEYDNTLPSALIKQKKYIDLRRYPLKGVRKIDTYSFQIILKGQYEQFKYWMAMPFFAPIPWEADVFYAQPEMDDRNITLSWYPIGTGPFMLTKNNPNKNMVLSKNPNFRTELFPANGSEADKKNGYMVHVGEKLPLIDKAVYTLEKESIPRWVKFMQGYYDASAISANSFDKAIRINKFGQPILSKQMKKKGIRLIQTLSPSIYYLGFNMLDNVVGGYTERARKLRQAISIAVNYDEDIAIFYNGRGLPAQGPIPPGIFGYHSGKIGMNPYVYQWVQNKRQRRSIAYAKQLLAEAGYPGGIVPKTGRSLILNYDVTTTSGPEGNASLNWMRKQFAKIGIDLNVQATLYNRFQDKMNTGDVQIFSWGWSADYPDPENFLFLLYGPNGKVKFGGENAANYENKQYDSLFKKMRNLPNGPERQQLIDKMVAIVRFDAPWVWGFIPKSFLLEQTWVSKVKPNNISSNTLKYVALNVQERERLRNFWNQPILWPLALICLVVLLLILPLVLAYLKREKQSVARMKKK